MRPSDIKSATDLVMELPLRLTPQPRIVQLATCTKEDSNYDSFRRCIRRYLDRAEVQHDQSLDDRPSNRQRYHEWLDLLTHNLPIEFANEHYDRLSVLAELYKLAYGGILEDLNSYGLLKGSLQTTANDLLSDCIRNSPLRHAGIENLKTIPVLLSDLTRNRMQELLRDCFQEVNLDSKRQCFLLLRSGCSLENGAVMHIPMLDFRISVSSNSLDIVSAAVKALLASIPNLNGCQGVILNSGQSYHFCGFTLMTNKELEDFLHRAILLIPIVDARYIGHSLRDHELCLRVSGRSLGDEGPIVESRIA